MTGPGTNTYLVGRGELAVVDPGPQHADHLAAIVAAAGDEHITYVLVTHTHPDHAPGARDLAARTGAQVIGFDARDGFSPDTLAGEATVIEGSTYALRAVHTPGHASNHLCWLLEGEQVLLSGDHVMDGGTVVIRPPDGDMDQYLRSLGRLLDDDPVVAAIAPGHGRLLVDPAPLLEATIAHRRQRERLVAVALARAGRARVDDLLVPVYDDVASERLPIARFSLWAHLRALAAAGRASSPDTHDVMSTWVSTATTAP
jgi:glyoxylase-like metal-dependent hydrolase (beta-lactamase superfamily II)